MAIKSALVQIGLPPAQVAVVFGIGCSGNMNDFLNVSAVHTLHGRAIPTAVGIKLANHRRPVLVVAGDGDCYGEGGNHLIHACRGNHDLAVIVHDNGVYGLTTGQVAPTASKGTRSKSTPAGIIETPINPLTLALTQGASFIAQAFAGDMAQTIAVIKRAMSHRGLALVNILQPCVTFNKINTYQYYRERVYRLADNDDKTDWDKAMSVIKTMDKERFPVGVIYEVERLSYHRQLPQLSGALPLWQRRRFTDFKPLEKEFR